MIQYSVKEEDVAGYVVDIKKVGGAFVITNTYEPPTIPPEKPPVPPKPPTTGDSNNLSLWTTIVLLSGLGIAITLKERIAKNRNKY